MEKKVNLKEMSTKQRIGYIWDYYKWHMIGAVLAVSVAVSILHHFITYREPLLNIIMINGGNNVVSEENNGFNEFLSAYGYDPSESPIACSSFYFPENDTAVSSAYLEQQALIAIIAAGEQDILLGNGTVYENYCRQGALVDLSTILSPELLSSYEDSFLHLCRHRGKCAVSMRDRIIGKSVAVPIRLHRYLPLWHPYKLPK